MAELEITVKTKDGKEIAISAVSAKTWAEIHKADAEERRIPVAQLCQWVRKNDRLMLQITDSIKSKIKTGCKTIIIDLSTGATTSGWNETQKNSEYYSNYQDLTQRTTNYAMGRHIQTVRA